ncbi:patatin-like phospholipase family protein [soil metagenome]|jgi:NTE family protein
MKIGIVLSGGGARGIAHLGVLQGLTELGIQPSIISGVSSGALVGALFAAGHSPKEILAIVKKNASPGLARMIIFSGGLFSAGGIKQIAKVTMPGDDFSKLHIPLYVTATDINSGTSATFSQGPLYDVLIGSSSIPPLFAPLKNRRQHLLDGGILNNLPVECISGKCDRIIGSHVNKLYPEKAGKLTRLQILDRSFHLAIADKVAINAALCDLFIEPPLRAYSMFDVKHADQIFKTGYQTIMKEKQLLLSWA